MDAECAWVALALVPGVGTRTFHRLIQRFGNPHRVFAASRRELEKVPGLKQDTLEAIMSFPAAEAARREAAELSALNIRIIHWGSPEYPGHLASIADPPALLYTKGELSPDDERAVAVVGSRQASAYGLTVCKQLCTELAWHGWTVVSGMARGIDSAAHLGALAGNGRTLAVLGTGPDVIYPAENTKLAERIVESGALITEFPRGTRPEPGNFPVRNRLISGLALGVVVVEATAKSGSLITARMALDQGRQVFAVPGALGREGVAGPHGLIKQGAKLVERVEDIIEELLPMVDSGRSAAAAVRQEDGPGVCPELDDRERRLWDLLSVEPVHIDPIARQLDLGVAEVAELLLRLELRGLVKQLPGTFFVRNVPY
jgi:DNA processing protein